MSMNIQKMEKVQLAELIEFVAVAEYRSFTRAAAQLGVSTATLIQMIRAVEDRLGLRLLDRATQHAAPTPAGERLLERLLPVLEDLESTLETPEAPAALSTGMSPAWAQASAFS
jgi:LysR family transcriptional regulator, regulator of peptidoglycan recycling